MAGMKGAGIRRHVFCLVALLEGLTTIIAEEPPKISWQPWSDGVFEQAKREHRFVLLDLEAVWCHWCHVL
jgi:thiol:disulfide interchange protein